MNIFNIFLTFSSRNLKNRILGFSQNSFGGKMNRTVNVFKLAAGVAGSFGLAATAPFTALMSGIILTRKKNPS